MNAGTELASVKRMCFYCSNGTVRCLVPRFRQLGFGPYSVIFQMHLAFLSLAVML